MPFFRASVYLLQPCLSTRADSLFSIPSFLTDVTIQRICHVFLGLIYQFLRWSYWLVDWGLVWLVGWFALAVLFAEEGWFRWWCCFICFTFSFVSCSLPCLFVSPCMRHISLFQHSLWIEVIATLHRWVNDKIRSLSIDQTSNTPILKLLSHGNLGWVVLRLCSYNFGFFWGGLVFFCCCLVGWLVWFWVFWLFVWLFVFNSYTSKHSWARKLQPWNASFIVRVSQYTITVVSLAAHFKGKPSASEGFQIILFWDVCCWYYKK